MQLRRRVQLVFLALAVLVAFDIGIGSWLISERDAARQVVRERWEPARTLVNAVMFGLLDQETGQRGFLITGRPEFLAPIDAGGQQVDVAVEGLSTLIGDDADIQPRLRRVEDRISAWLQLGARFEIDAKQAGRDEEVIVLVATGTSTRLFREAGAEVHELRDAIVDRLAADEERVNDLQSLIFRLEVARALLALGLAGAGAYLLRRWLSLPLEELGGAIRTVVAGDLDHTIPAPGPPELAGLGRDVEAMRQRILAEVDDASRARASLSQRGMIVVTLRDELAPSAITPPPSLSVATRFRPAETIVAGDWYEVRRTGENGLAFALGDVSGHGAAAGVFALKTKQLVCAALDLGLPPAAVWSWVAARLGDTGDRFLTGVIATVEPSAGTVTYSSAGHPALLLCSGGTVTTLCPTGPIVGPLPGTWTNASVPLRPGSYVVAYSDGLLEIQDGQRWAELDDLAEHLRGAPAGDVELVADLCMSFHDTYAQRPSDDVTVVVVGPSA